MFYLVNREFFPYLVEQPNPSLTLSVLQLYSSFKYNINTFYGRIYDYYFFKTLNISISLSIAFGKEMTFSEDVYKVHP